MKASDLVGQRFGMLVVEKRVGTKTNNNGSKLVLWHCICDCGGSKDVVKGSLVSGNTRSCGCLRLRAEVTGGNLVEYTCWRDIMRRCYNTTHTDYKHYGARGIEVANEWHEFRGFFTSMGKKPSTEYSIDRIDNDGNYSPENCRWATDRQQNNNRSNNVILEFLGRRMTVAQWAKEIGVRRDTVCSRLKYGFTVEDALTLPVGMKQRRGCKRTFGLDNVGRHKDGDEQVFSEFEAGVA